AGPGLLALWLRDGAGQPLPWPAAPPPAPPPGLGLELVEEAGGMVLRLPLAPAHPMPVAPAPLLLVDDDALLRDHMAAQLSGLGYRVTAVADGPAALRAVEQGLRPLLLLADVVLPGGISGVALARALRRRLPRLRVLLVSAFAAAAPPNGAAEEEFPLLAKPCTLAELRARLEALRQHDLDHSPS
ncbi:response regulator, partial [Roseomonas sp. GC11]|uniref:response regulator n=1 Tax=Roseomonas sp. GC11 TaxID=2950546 RepID=UPI00210D69E1